MSELTTFPERDKCPTVCNAIGAYKLSDKNPEQMVEEMKQNAKTAQLQLSQPESTTRDEEPPGTAGSVRETPLPNLRPAPDGKVDWTPLGDMTGTRPPVNKYSISRYSLNEWRNHNEKVLDPKFIVESNIVDYNAKTALMQGFGTVDKNQLENDKRLKQKAKDLYRWKIEVEKACKAISEEVVLLEVERQRLKGASRVLMLPESVSKECLELRSSRFETDLVADLAEHELIKEMNLVKEVRATLEITLKQIEEQLKLNKIAKHRIEYDWCDKTMAYNTEAMNIGLDVKSKTIMFNPGATRFGDYTAPLEYWEHFCRENIQNIEATRQNSVDLRGSLNAILVSNGKKLRTQADRTDMALAETVAITTELATKLEETLRTTLHKIADMECLIAGLQSSIRQMDAAMKLAQTRLNNRNNLRPHGENVRDQPHVGLIDEVKKIHQTVTSLLGQLRNSESIRDSLCKKRIELERNIAAKRMTLSIDRDRCGMIRTHYPSAAELAGY